MAEFIRLAEPVECAACGEMIEAHPEHPNAYQVDADGDHTYHEHCWEQEPDDQYREEK